MTTTRENNVFQQSNSVRSCRHYAIVAHICRRRERRPSHSGAFLTLAKIHTQFKKSCLKKLNKKNYKTVLHTLVRRVVAPFVFP